jgi:XTP/dITP diphosphohydrolase
VTAVTFVSTNPGKVREVREILSAYGLTVRWKRRELPEPQADRVEDVVRVKLDSVADVPGPVMVEDSGLFIPALGGFPGVYSAHILRIWKFRPILELMRTRPRAAYYRSVVGVRHGRKRWFFAGEVSGSIARRPAGTGGFGYDPIFIPAGWRRTFAQGTPEEKNAISHRGRAVRQAGEALGTPPPRAPVGVNSRN